VDLLVRAASIRALSQSRAAPALLDIAASLSDPEPEVRFEAVSAIAELAGFPAGTSKYLSPMLGDENAKVSTRTAVALLRIDRTHDRAKKLLRQMAVFGDYEARTHAIAALGDWGDVEAFEFLANELQDRTLTPATRRNILVSMTRIDSTKSVPWLIDSLGSRDWIIVDAAAGLLASMGVEVFEPVLRALQEEDKTDGALLALKHLPLPPVEPVVQFARTAVRRAVEYDALTRSVRMGEQNEAMTLLAQSLENKTNEYGVQALRAIGLLGDREAMNTAVENLQARDAAMRANVIEALESISAKWRDILQPLMRLWEEDRSIQADIDWDRLLGDSDPWIREWAAFARDFGEKKMDTISTLSLMDRILFLKRVSLFATLSPTDLKQVAAIASEEIFPDGEVIAHRGEQGDAMFVIVSGEVRICIENEGVETELARRRSGEYVGELSIINREPRNATLIASGDVRALCIDQKTFEGLIRERPEVSLFIIQVLSRRLKELMEKK
jgi:CRP/FNR family transcriptional regulator, cyclic AMP receptor protein